jgi:hypothetical protein
MQYSPQVAQIPPEIYQTAGTYQLGNVVAEHGLSSGATVGPVIVGIFLGVLGGVFIFNSLNTENSSGAGVGIGLFFVVVGILLIGASARNRQGNAHVYACERGLIYTKSNTSPQPMRWESLLVWRAVTKHYRNGIYTGTSYSYTLQRDDGYKIVLSNNIKGIADLGKYISDRVTAARFPAYLQAYNAGQALSFGQLTISTQGVGNGRELLPWNDVNDIDVQSGFIKVKRAGGWFSWKTVAASAIPNLFIFLALSDYVLHQYGKK